MPGITPKREPGWIGAIIREQAQGSDVIPNGARVVKASAETGVPAGTVGVVLGSVYFDSLRGELCLIAGDKLLYFVEWSTAPRVAMCVHWHRIRKV